MPKIEIDCCECKERYGGECLKRRCPMYSQVSADVFSRWTYIPTGFGPLIAPPSHEVYLSAVRDTLKKLEPKE